MRRWAKRMCLSPAMCCWPTRVPPLAPLVQRLLLERSESLQPLWSKARLEGLLLEDVLQTSAGTGACLGRGSGWFSLLYKQ